ncbi:MAG: hypothetical protein UIG52_00615 [Bacteroidales bacterium]|nr:hypothetical protein [Bacteroidales bacterium]
MRILDCKRTSLDNKEVEIYRYKYNLSKGIIERYISVDGGSYFTYLITIKRGDFSKKEWEFIAKEFKLLLKNKDTAPIF